MQAKDIKNVAVIGAGMISPGVAQVFAATKFNVYVYARRPEVLPGVIDRIRANLSVMAKKGLGTESDIEPTIKRIKTTSDLHEAVAGAHFVVECVAENLQVKQDIFQQMDQMSLPDAILATNTSVMSITEIASKSQGRARIVGTHFWNPPHLIPLVEVVKGNDTSTEVHETTYQVLKAAGKRPVKVMKDVPGFLANRLQHALWREAISIVERGIADPASVDYAIRNSFGARLAVLGPIENADMAGLDLTLSIHDYVLKYLESSPSPSPVLKEKVAKGQLGFKTGQGFLTWTPEQIEKSRANLTEYLIEWNKREQGK